MGRILVGSPVAGGATGSAKFASAPAFKSRRTDASSFFTVAKTRVLQVEEDSPGKGGSAIRCGGVDIRAFRDERVGGLHVATLDGVDQSQVGGTGPTDRGEVIRGEAARE